MGHFPSLEQRALRMHFTIGFNAINSITDAILMSTADQRKLDESVKMRFKVF